MVVLRLGVVDCGGSYSNSSRYCRLVWGTGPIPGETHFPCGTSGARVVCAWQRYFLPLSNISLCYPQPPPVPTPSSSTQACNGATSPGEAVLSLWLLQVYTRHFTACRHDLFTASCLPHHMPNICLSVPHMWCRRAVHLGRTGVERW